MGVWQFLQDQLLGMKWLNALIGNGLEAMGIDTGGRIGGSIQFFVYDVLKITVLLCVLIFLISYLQSFFPPERSQPHFGPVSRNRGQRGFCAPGNGDTVLLLLLHSAVYGIYQCGIAAGGDVFFSHLLADGGLGKLLCC